MKYLKNVHLQGWQHGMVGKDGLTFRLDPNSSPEPLCPYNLIVKLTPNSVSLEASMAQLRSWIKVFDSVAEQENAEYIEVGDEDWSVVRPLIENAVRLNYRIHAPAIMDHLDELVNVGKDKDQDRNQNRDQDSKSAIVDISKRDKKESG